MDFFHHSDEETRIGGKTSSFAVIFDEMLLKPTTCLYVEKINRKKTQPVMISISYGVYSIEV
jgi:hypothetical protein